MNFRFDLDDSIDEEADDTRLVGGHGVVHAGNLVAGVVLDPGMKKQNLISLGNVKQSRLIVTSCFVKKRGFWGSRENF